MENIIHGDIKSMYRTIKIVAGMMGEYEIIRTNAPDEVIEKQLANTNQMQENGKEIADTYGFIKAEGYICNILGCQDDFDEEQLIIDKDFDYYDY